MADMTIAGLTLAEIEALWIRRMAAKEMAPFAALNHDLAELVPALVARVRELEEALSDALEAGAAAHGACDDENCAICGVIFNSTAALSEQETT